MRRILKKVGKKCYLINVVDIDLGVGPGGGVGYFLQVLSQLFLTTENGIPKLTEGGLNRILE